MEAQHLSFERRQKSSEVSVRGCACWPSETRVSSLAPTRPSSCWVPVLQVPAQPPQRSVDSVSQGSSTSSFSSVSASSRPEEAKKDYREVRLAGGRAETRAGRPCVTTTS